MGASGQSEMAATVSRITARFRRGPDVREVFDSVRRRLAGTPQKRALLLKRAKLGGPALLAVLGLSAWLVLRPVPQPDYRKDSLRKVFNYTLLTDEFNRLPVEQRLELIGQLVSRLKNMSSGDSAMLAAFAAGIAGAAREQLEENASRLAIDLWDKYAEQYKDVKAEDRGAWLDATFIEFTKSMETVAGEPRDIPDEQRLAEVRRQAQRDLEQFRSGRLPPGRMMGRAFDFARNGVGAHAAPTQRTRGQLLMRDMVRRMRGEDVSGPR